MAVQQSSASRTRALQGIPLPASSFSEPLPGLRWPADSAPELGLQALPATEFLRSKRLPVRAALCLIPPHVHSDGLRPELKRVVVPYSARRATASRAAPLFRRAASES